MSDPAVLVSQSGRVTPGLAELVSAAGYDLVDTTVTEGSEDGELFLSPATVDRLEESVSAREDEPLVVVDGHLHEGQAVDLSERLSPLPVRDMRSVVWEHLSETNRVAAARLDLWEARRARREAAAAQRASATQGPDGTSGRLDAAKQRVQRCRETLETRREQARERVRRGYGDVGGSLVLLGRVGAPTTALWTALTGDSGPATAGRPAQPTTGTTQLGPHTLAVVDTPGIPGDAGIPSWLTEAVPGLAAVVGDATCVLGVGDHTETLRDGICDEFDVTWRSVEDATAAAARDAVGDLFETAACAVRLPYDDAAHALASTLHDEAAVHETEYGDAVYLRVAVPRSSVDEYRRRVQEVDGELRVLDSAQ